MTPRFSLYLLGNTYSVHIYEQAYFWIFGTIRIHKRSIWKETQGMDKTRHGRLFSTWMQKRSVALYSIRYLPLLVQVHLILEVFHCSALFSKKTYKFTIIFLLWGNSWHVNNVPRSCTTLPHARIIDQFCDKITHYHV